MTTTMGNVGIVTQDYKDFKDDMSDRYGNGYDICGPRIHYITYLNHPSTVAITKPDLINPDMEFLMLRTTNSGNPSSYRIEVKSNNYKLAGLQKLVLNVDLPRYPMATMSKVYFEVLLKPCEVTEFVPPSPITLDY